MQISGATRVFAILADPIEQVMTPRVINDWFAQQGFNGVMVPVHVAPENLSSVVLALRTIQNLDGFVVTVPHKTAMLRLCDELTTGAKEIGAVNVVHRTVENRLIGAMFDGEAFVKGLRAGGVELAGKAIYLCGAGGAASAIAFALSAAGVSEITIANRTTHHAAQLVQRLLLSNPEIQVRVGSTDPSGHDVVINATTVGMKESDPLPLDGGKLRENQVVAEIIMLPAETRLLSFAKSLGCKVHYGAPMLDAQIQLMADFMMGKG